MVSIPDWTKFRGVGEPHKEITPASNKYNKQREEEAIKQAEEHGYFSTASKAFIEEKFLKEDEGEKKTKTRSYLQGKEPQKELSTLTVLKLNNHHLRGVGDIGMCSNLRICVLGSNYITRFDALVSCIHLIKLDLHSNQITVLPGSSFWASMRQLCVLNLHDNPVGHIENLQYLAACPSLIALTLQDTPLSLKRNYRHHVVNSIWTLKALDNHVISDEEIIEDADFGSRFSAMHRNFRIDLCPPSQQDATFKDELHAIYSILAEVNYIMAHNSPVLIMQRYLRGYLLRKRYKLVQDMRIWAAVTIQRTYRDWKGIETPRTQIPPPPSPVTVPNKTPLALQQAAQSKLDYDTYMKNRRPGSVGLSESGSLSSDRRPKPSPIPSTPVHSDASDLEGRKKNIFINLAKLQAGTLYNLQDEAMMFGTALSSDQPTAREEYRQEVTMVTRKGSKKKPIERKRLKNIKKFFGPVVETATSTPEPGFSIIPAEEQEIPVVDFRLRGRQQTVQYYDATTDMIIARREAGKEIRAAEDEFHRQSVYVQKRAPKLVQQGTDQRMFARIQGTMGLTCLQAIQQAYKDREKAERRAAKFESVLTKKEQRDTAKERIRLYHEEKRSKAMSQKESDQKRMMDQLEQQEMQRVNSLQKYNDMRKQSSHYEHHRRGELTFISDFNAQNTSVSNALLRHDRHARVEDHLNEKVDFIQAQRNMEVEQQDVVKKYMEHRQLMRQTESAMSRAAVDTKMLQEANDRLMLAKARVSQQKTMNDNVQAFYPLPSITNQSLPKVSEGRASSVSLKNFEKWNTNKLVRHHTVAI